LRRTTFVDREKAANSERIVAKQALSLEGSTLDDEQRGA
jgi:hypothetical protein